MIYDNLIFNEPIFNNLLKFKLSNKLPNAFIFHGINGIGKEAHAIEFFAALNCKENKNNACGYCNSCKKVKKMQHENLEIIFSLPKSNVIGKNDSPYKALNNNDIELMHSMLLTKGSNPYFKIQFKSANTILINSIREIKKNITLSINDDEYKLYLILDAEKLCYPKSESANSLLKILEEPPKNIFFILVTSDISYLLDTIISRCVPIYFPKLKNDNINKYLMEKNPNNSSKNIEISNISDGSIEKALSLLKNYENDMKSLHVFVSLLLDAKYSSIDKISHFKNKSESIELLNLLNLFFRNLILKKTDFKYMIDLQNAINAKYQDVDWSKCILLTNNTQKYILKNGNIELSINSLIFEIKKQMNHKYHNINILDEYLNYKV